MITEISQVKYPGKSEDCTNHYAIHLHKANDFLLCFGECYSQFIDLLTDHTPHSSDFLDVSFSGLLMLAELMYPSAATPNATSVSPNTHYKEHISEFSVQVVKCALL